VFHQVARLVRTPQAIERYTSLCWHCPWIECDRPRSGVVADCVRRIRAAYHYAIRPTRRDEKSIVRECIAEAFLTDPTRNVWEEVERIRNKKTTQSKTVDSCTYESSIAQVFASQFISLYTSVSYDAEVLKLIITEIDASMLYNARVSAFIIKACEAKEAIDKLK